MTRIPVSPVSRGARGVPARAIAPLTLVLAALTATVLTAACGGDSSGPGNGGNNGPTTASVEVLGASNTIQAGESVQLTATAKDASGNVLSGKTFAWSSNNQGVATVTPSGLVNGVAAGQATISATVDNRSGSFTVTVTAVTPLVISNVTPNPLVPGQAATITGTGFSAVPQSNVVTIAGVNTTVTSATTTSLNVNVPATLCAAGNAAVTVRVGAQTSNPFQAPAQAAATAVNLAVGEQTIVSVPANFCFEFPATAGSEAYLVGIQSISSDPRSVTSTTVAASGATPGPALTALQLPPNGTSAHDASPAALPIDAATAERWRRHRVNESIYRERERALMQPHFAAMSQAYRQRMAAATNPALDAVSSAAIPGNLNVGDNVSIKVINRNTNVCSQFNTVTAVVRAIGQHAVWLEDAANPAGGYTTADFQNMAAQFDATIYPNDVANFGQPDDTDGNGRIALLVTKEVNQYDILGFVTSADFNPNCNAGNLSDIIYLIAPDPNNANEQDRYSRAAALRDAPVLLMHELVHVIQFTRRLAASLAFPMTWELEGQATYAEMEGGFAATGRTPGQNYGFNTVFNCSEPPGQQCVTEIDPNDWFVFTFIDLILYYGFNANCDANTPGNCDIPLAGAPEQCTWIASGSQQGNTAPCITGREVYGVPAMLYAWLADQFASTFAGGRADVMRRLVTGTQTGYAALADLTGRPFPELLAQWAASLYIDDRVPGANAKLTLPSWNLVSVESRLRESAQLNPRERSFGSFTDAVQVRAGSTAYFRLSGAGRPSTVLRVRGDNEAILPSTMQVWIVRMQ